MTAQIAEKLIWNGETHTLCSQPLDDYLALLDEPPRFEAPSSALWRGYLGTWEIAGERLYLVALSGYLAGGDAATLELVFPDCSGRVFAHWFSGTLRIAQGKLLRYVHQAFESRHERDALIEVESGIIKKSWVNINGQASDPRAPSAYGPGALTIFARKAASTDEGE